MTEMGSRTSSPLAMIGATPQNNRSRRSFTPKIKPIPPKPKLKHMDSQIDFVPVEGTPELEAQDSQLMTEHQKEVREEQAQAASLFPELATGATRKSRRILGSPQLKYHSPDTPIHMQTNESPTVVPETIIKKDTAKTPELIGSFVSESHIASTSGSALGSQSSVERSTGEINRGHPDKGLYKGCDAAISHHPDSSQATPTKHSLILPDAHSDEPDGDDNFVDAPDHFDSDPRDLDSTTGQRPPPSDIAELTVAISPLQDPSEYETVDVPDSPAPSPDAQICSEIMSASDSPFPKANKKRGNKRKRPEGKLVDQSPEIPEAIIAEPEQPPASIVQSLLQQSPKLERPSKKARASATPVKLRASARTTKGNRYRGLRNATSRFFSSGTDPDQTSGKNSPFPPPCPVNAALTATSSRSTSSRLAHPHTNTPAAEENSSKRSPFYRGNPNWQLLLGVRPPGEPGTTDVKSGIHPDKGEETEGAVYKRHQRWRNPG